ncbi:hypothetical protein [Streptomyces sp. NPDC018584]|uniref:hypothetical protein n=1 Tax=unclassified Streptomyces TaxID=2593676 RepID=UPI0037877AD7
MTEEADAQTVSFVERDIVAVTPHSRIFMVSAIDEESGMLTIMRPGGLTWEVDTESCRPANSSELKEWRLSVGIESGARNRPVPGCPICGTLNLKIQRERARDEDAEEDQKKLSEHIDKEHGDSVIQ